jgi:DNA processing protein
LLREGAALIETPEELIAELGLAALGVAPTSAELAPAAVLRSGLARAILRSLIGETLSLDEIIERVGAAPSETLSELAELELSGAVSRSPGGLYHLLRTRPSA